jgi:hypothetical protein
VLLAWDDRLKGLIDEGLRIELTVIDGKLSRLF